MLVNKRLPLTVALVGIAILAQATVARAAEGHKISPEEEAKQLAVLRSGAEPAEKAIACKRLAIDGSSAAVPDLAVLLHDPQLASWARIALEAIPGPEADEALRTASDSLQGLLLVGTINSIGVRRDSGAVDRLKNRLNDQDAEVAAAAAVALGKICGDEAVKALREALAVESMAVRSAVAEGCILCAEQLQANGREADAAQLFDAVRKAEVPKQRVLEATRGAILARGQDGIPLLLEQLQAADEPVFRIALATAREFPGDQVDKSLAASLGQANPERAALIVAAMADRPDTVDLAAVLKAAGDTPLPVRVAALRALARVGNDSCLEVLLKSAIDADEQVAEAANATLGVLPGEKVDEQIVALLPAAKDKTYLLLVELVGQRRIAATAPLLKALESADPAVRAAALASLGKTIGPDELAVLIAQALKPAHAEDREAAEKALKEASVRMPDRESCAAQLVNALAQASTSETKQELLEVLAAVGGTNALTALGEAAKGGDSQLQDVSSKLLGEWMTEDAAPVLLDLAKTAPDAKIKVRALRGYLRIARQFVLPIDQRAEMCALALDVAQQPSEKKLVIEILRRYPSVETLVLAKKLMQDPDLRDDAFAAVFAMVPKMAAAGVNLADAIGPADFADWKVEIVKAEYGADATQKDVTEIVRKQSAGSPIFAVPDSYNAAFTDPTPDTVKQLKIQYAINGKAGEATFAENALIVLPMPK